MTKAHPRDGRIIPVKHICENGYLRGYGGPNWKSTERYALIKATKLLGWNNNKDIHKYLHKHNLIHKERDLDSVTMQKLTIKNVMLKP